MCLWLSSRNKVFWELLKSLAQSMDYFLGGVINLVAGGDDKNLELWGKWVMEDLSFRLCLATVSSCPEVTNSLLHRSFPLQNVLPKCTVLSNHGLSFWSMSQNKSFLHQDGFIMCLGHCCVAVSNTTILVFLFITVLGRARVCPHLQDEDVWVRGWDADSKGQSFRFGYVSVWHWS